MKYDYVDLASEVDGSHIAAELRRLAGVVERETLQDPFELIEGSHLWIRTKPPNSRLIPIDLTTMTRPQRKFYDRVKQLYREGKPIRIRILKARQMGFSTVIQALLFAFTCCKGMSSLVVANDAENSEWLFQMSKRFHEILSERKTYKLPPLKRSTLKMIALKGTDSEMRHGTAESPNLGTTVTRGGCHLSEYAFYRDPNTLMSKILGSIPHVAGTIIIKETTANGQNQFYDDWTDEDNEPGTTGFENFFFGWPEHDEYAIYSDEPLAEQLEPKLAKYEAELRELHGCNDAQIRWFWEKLKEFKGNLPAFWEMFPAKPSEAFRASGVTVFESIKDTLTRISVKKSEERSEWGHFASAFVNRAPLTVQVFQRPRTGVAYAIGADVSEGLTLDQRREMESSGRLRDVHKTFSTGSVRRCDTRELCALMETQEPVGPYAEQLRMLGCWYNNALLGIECNNAGHAVIDRMILTQYQNLYCSVERLPDNEYRQTRDWGWQTRSDTKGKLESDWEDFVREHPNLLGSWRLAKQALTHVVLGTRSHGPMRGCFNDLLFADMICIQMIEASGLAGVTAGDATMLSQVMKYYENTGIEVDLNVSEDY